MKVSIIDRLSPELKDLLEALEVEVDYRPNIRPEEVPALIQESDILVMNSKVKLDKALIDNCAKLKLVIRAGVGLDHIDVAYGRTKGILVKNMPGVNAISVAEQTVGMLLSLHHWLQRASGEVKQFLWLRAKNRATEIAGKTVGIIGYGNTGSEVAKRLKAFDCKVLAYDKYKKDFGTLSVIEADMQLIFEETQILSLHVPLTDETKNMVNYDYLSKFRHPITLLNLARGPVVHLESLIDALDAKQVVAAGLDVLPNERFHRLNDYEIQLYQNLFARDNVMLAPHIGGWSFESKLRIRNLVIDYIREFLKTH